MSKERDVQLFAELGDDIKAARAALSMSRKALAEKLNISTRYLANIENSGAFPSLPVFYDIVTILKLPVEKYFHGPQEPESEQRKRTSLKLRLCPERYLPIVESTLDGAIKVDEAEAAE